MSTKLLSALCIVLAVGCLWYFNGARPGSQHPTGSQESDPLFEKGAKLYQANCIACHDAKMTETATAPPLGGITKKRDLNWLYEYTKNPNAPRFKSDPIVAKIRAQGWGLMSASPHLTKADLKALYYYIEARYQLTLKGVPVKDRDAFGK